VNGCEGLEEIGEGAFAHCTSLHEILITPAVKLIKEKAFFRCSQLTIVNRSKELEEIGHEAFCECTSLNEIVIPPAVKAIKDRAFIRCSK
jgi:hypothetical protein